MPYRKRHSLSRKLRPLGRALRRLWDRGRRRWKRLPRRVRGRVARLTLGALAFLLAAYALASSCRAPPENPRDLCSVFAEKRSWYRAAKRSFEEWGVPEAVQMAIIFQESSFRRRVRPPRRRFLWIFPGPRPSSAYGYGQVVEGTWISYLESTGRRHAQRDDFTDVAHFVGWYGDHIHQATGLAKDDALGLYLAYHEGPRGFLLGRHRGKPWLVEAARQVERRAARYQEQYDGCRERLERWWIFW